MSDRPAELFFLVVGTARSGTTLVQRLCCELPQVWIPAETHFWSMASEAADAFDWPLQGEDRHAAVEYLLRDLAGGALPATPAKVTTEMTRRGRRIGLWTVFESLVSVMSPPDRSVLGEKTPNHMFWWEQLLAAQPGLKLLAVVRDPRAVLRSHRGVVWGEHDAHALAERWVAHLRAALDAVRIFGDGRVMILRYEDVVSDPDAARSQIAGFLGVADEPIALSDDLLAGYPLFPESEDWKARALGSVSLDRISAGEGLAPADANVIEAACGSLMQAVGYPVGHAPGVGPPQGESLDRVLAFRRRNASVSGTLDLPIY